MNKERFETPDGGEDLILECDGCGNLLFVRHQDGIKVAACPICGCINNVEMEQEPSEEELTGRLILKSPLMSMNRNSVEEGRVSLPGLPEKVQEALLWLQENRWTFGFSLEQPLEEDGQGEGGPGEDESGGEAESES